MHHSRYNYHKNKLSRMDLIAKYPSGFGNQAEQEIRSMLKQPLFLPHQPASDKTTNTLPKLTIRRDRIVINAASYFQMVELLYRSHTLFDLCLPIYQTGSIHTNQLKQLSIPFLEALRQKGFFLRWIFKSRNGLPLKILQQAFSKQRTPDTNRSLPVYIESYPQKFLVSVSLAGEPLYQRKIRTPLAKSAPVREDIAAACLHVWKTFIGNELFQNTNQIYIPFCGSGTFLFEYLNLRFQLSPGLFRKFALLQFPYFHSSHFNYLTEKARQYLQQPSNAKLTILCQDTNPQACQYLHQQWQESPHSHIHSIDCQIEESNFFCAQPPSGEHTAIFINPPYGRRIFAGFNSQSFYQAIADKIYQWQQTGRAITGFLFCPETSLLSTSQQILKKTNTCQTLPFSQGGKRIHLLVFRSKN